ncbi:hypothetical protein COCNU_07G013730 [Cocos nucifera]|uniref:Uncharacterized protein n=1 Tax=Cocos nucifera TaxID=13894 RepID=A0A8K0IFU4_COCNU|nr:hypothetical protein COCNU_07G013730 [Cocos nucifera]
MLQLSSARRRQAKASSTQSRSPGNTIARVSDVAPPVMPLPVPVNMRGSKSSLVSEPVNPMVETRVGPTNLAIVVVDMPTNSIVETVVKVVLIVSLVHVTIKEHPTGEASIESLSTGTVKVAEMTKLSKPAKTIETMGLSEQMVPVFSLPSIETRVEVSQLAPLFPSAMEILRIAFKFLDGHLSLEEKWALEGKVLNTG